MPVLRTAPLSIAMALVLAPAGVATAQDSGTEADIEVGAPASVTGSARPVRTNQLSHTEPGAPPMVVATTNYGWTLEMETDDPRLSGEFETNQNDHIYTRGVTVRNGIGRLTNEGGSWTVEFHGFTPSRSSNHYALYFTGEGGYAGLSAMLLMRPAPGGWEVQGVIAPEPWPEPPEWVLPPAE